MRLARILVPSLLCALALALVGGRQLAAQPDRGFFSFEGTSVSLRDWGPGGEGYDIGVDSTVALDGRSSLRSRWTSSSPRTNDIKAFGVTGRSYPIALVAGRRLRYTGYIRADHIEHGFAGMWLRVDGPDGRVLAFDNMSQRGVTGTRPWTRYQIELPVDSGASGVYFGIIHPGDGTAWFDSLVIEAVGSPTPRRVAAVPPEPPRNEDDTRLLTDAELALAKASTPTLESRSVTDYVRREARPIRSIVASDFADLRFLAPLVQGKRLVQLGESGHGVSEFNLAKVRLIKYLHEELGYDVIAFESSIFECDIARRATATSSAVGLMRTCIFGVWHVEENVPLFEYIKATQATSHPLTIAGFDEQTSSASVSSRPDELYRLISVVDTAYARHVRATDAAFLADLNLITDAGERPAIKAAESRYTAFYDSLATFIEANRSRLQRASASDTLSVLAARQAARSMTYYVRQLAAGMTTQGTEVRDLGMANNLDVLMDEMYPGKKVVVWAHNFHIQHRENTRTLKAAVAGTAPAPRTMGTYVAERRRAELYTIGLFMYRGQAAMNNRQVYWIAVPKPGSLESILHQAPWRYAFIDFSRARREPGSEWMWQPITSFGWGTTPETIVPRDEYDGVLFIDTVHPPRYR